MSYSLKHHFFFSLIASSLNYLFHFILLKLLSPDVFAEFTAIWAYMSFAMIFGTIGLYFVAMRPLDSKTFQILFWSILMITLLFTVIGLNSSWLWLISAITLASFVYSLISGRFLGGGELKKYASLINLSAGLKILFLIALFLIGQLRVNFILCSLVFSFLVTNLIFWNFLSKQNDSIIPPPQSGGVLSALIMAFVTHAFPVFDILWFELWQGKVPVDYAPLSLINRTIFFVQLMFAQWLLSQMVRQVEKAQRLNLSKAFIVCMGCIVLSLSFKFLLKALSISSIELAVVHCVSTGLLAGILALGFLEIQAEVTRQKMGFALFFILTIGLIWTLGGFFKFDFFKLQWIFIFCLSLIFILFRSLKTDHSSQ